MQKLQYDKGAGIKMNGNATRTVKFSKSFKKTPVDNQIAAESYNRGKYLGKKENLRAWKDIPTSSEAFRENLRLSR